MKKRNAFTLAELLAVLVILAVIALIVFPKIGDVINDSEKKAFARSVDGLLEAAKLDHKTNYKPVQRKYKYENSELTLIAVGSESQNKNIKVEGIIENGVGTLSVDKGGNTSLIIYNDKYCAIKFYNDKTITVEECMKKTFTEVMEPLLGTEVNNNDPDHNLRYVGADPDNYVWFNNELWRIIGVFDGKTKIIKDEYYSTAIAWDEGRYNSWEVASLKSLLNDGDTSFLKAIEVNDSTSYSYIDLEHVWNLAGPPSPEVPTESEKIRSNMYILERGTTVYPEMPITWTGAIGLMYPSDYGYSTSSTSSNCDLNMWAWNSYSECYENSWLYDSNYYQWTITPRSDWRYLVFRLSPDGIIVANNSNAISGSFYPDATTAARPVLYLKSNVKIMGGFGTYQRPFILTQ